MQRIYQGRGRVRARVADTADRSIWKRIGNGATAMEPRYVPSGAEASRLLPSQSACRMELNPLPL